jgi:hypothetical protein
LQELGAGEAAFSQRVDDVFDLRGDGVLPGELGVLEEIAHQALGEEVLYQHLVDLSFGEIGVEGGPAKGDEIGEGFAEGFVLFVGFVDVGVEGLGEVGDAVFEFLHGAAEFAFVGFVVGEETVEEIGYLNRFD